MDTELITLLGDVRIPAPNKHFQRIPTEYIFYMIRDGHMDLVENEIPYRLYPGDILLLEPSKLHYGIRVNSLIEYSFIHISMENYFTDTKGLPGKTEDCKAILQFKKISLSHGQFQSMVQLYEELKNTYHLSSPYREAKMRSLFTLFVINLLEFQNNSAATSNRNSQNCGKLIPKLSTRDISNYLRQNCQKPIRSSDLENTFHHNFDYMNRLFKADFGMTVFQYLEDYRIAEAKKMLQSRAFSVSQIAENLGFCNRYYFSRVFKKKTGVAPSNWNKE